MLYFAKALDRDIVKIGWTMEGVAVRLRQLRHRYGHNVSFVALAPGGADEERREHDRFKAHRILGEWFLWCDEIAARVEELRARHPDFEHMLEHSRKLAAAVVTRKERQLALPPGTQLPMFTPDREPSLSAPPETDLRNLLAEHRGNVAAVGRAYGKQRMQVHRWLKRYGIDVSAYR